MPDTLSFREAIAFVAAVGVLVASLLLRQWATPIPHNRMDWTDEWGWQETPIPNPVQGVSEEIRMVALAEGLDPALVAAIIQVESDFQADARSPRGALGLMQVMPETAAFVGLSADQSPEDNLRAGCRYLRWLFDGFGSDVELVLAAYNAGPGMVYRYGGIPPFRETQAFVRKVGEAYRLLTGQPLEATRIGF